MSCPGKKQVDGAYCEISTKWLGRTYILPRNFCRSKNAPIRRRRIGRQNASATFEVVKILMGPRGIQESVGSPVPPIAAQLAVDPESFLHLK